MTALGSFPTVYWLGIALTNTRGQVPHKSPQQYEDEIIVLREENKQLKQKIEALESKVCIVEKRCACYRNNQKLCEDKKNKE